jgi:hypothetical protein
MSEYSSQEAGVLLRVLQFEEVTKGRTTEPAALEALEQERARLKSKVPEYFVQQRPHLRSLIEVMGNVFAESDGMESRWTSTVDSMEQNRQQNLGKLHEGLKDPSQTFLSLVSQICEEERVFIEALRGLEAPQRYGLVVRALRQLRYFNNYLRNNYKDLVNAIRPLQEMQRAATSFLEQLLEGASRLHATREAAARTALSTAASNLRALASKAGGSGGPSLATSGADEASRQIDATLQTLTQAAQELRALATEVDRSLATLRTAQGNEQKNVHPIFRGLRSQTESYLNPTPPDRAEKLLDSCEEQATIQADRLKVTASREDLNKLSGDLLKKADDVIGKIKSAYDELKSEHSGRFFGSLSDATGEELLCTKAWAERWTKMSGYPAAYAGMRDRAKQLFEADLLGAYDELIRAVKAQKPDGEAVATALGQKRRDLESRLDTCKQELSAALEAVTKLLGGSELSGLYQRSEMKSSLGG